MLVNIFFVRHSFHLLEAIKGKNYDSKLFFFVWKIHHYVLKSISFKMMFPAQKGLFFSFDPIKFGTRRSGDDIYAPFLCCWNVGIPAMFWNPVD